MHPTFRRNGFEGATQGSAGRALLLSIPLFVLAFLGAGCGGSADDEDSSSGSDTAITINEEHDWSSAENQYAWESPGSTARVSLELQNFHHGSILVTVNDSLGATVFSRLYQTEDWFWQLDGELSDIDLTAAGAPGPWAIILECSELTADVTLVVDSTEAPPPNPAAPDATSNSDLLDPSFGTAGRATYEPDTAAARRLAVDSVGRVVACGTLLRSNGSRRLAVWRYSSSGILDIGFGDDGVQVHEDSAVFASGAFDVAVDGNNRVLVAGWIAPDPDRRTDLAVFRFSSLGTPDVTFGDDGVLTLDEGEDETGVALAVDTIGRVLVAGSSRNQDDTAGHLVVLRLLGSGDFDVTFDGDGIVRTNVVSDRAMDLALVSNDTIVLGTRSGNLILWKFMPGGGLDGSFGSGGIATSVGTAGEFRVGEALQVKEDGTLGVAGVRFHSDGSGPPELALWRFQANGLPLLLFNSTGFATYRHPDGWAAGSGIGFDSSDRLLVSGVTRSSGLEESDSSATCWRYIPTGAIDLSLRGASGTGVGRFDPRPRNAGTTASSLLLLGDGGVLVPGTVFSRDTNAVDLVIWKLEP